jgi:phage terminase large subunit GpA-like protein
MDIRLAFIDSGSGSHAPEVYRWARQHPTRVRPSKGYQSQESPLRASVIDSKGKGKRRHGGLELITIDTNYIKDQLAECLTKDPDEHGAWFIHSSPSSEYVRQMASEHKVRKRQAGRVKSVVWEPKPGRAANHYWDTEVYAMAAAGSRGDGGDSDGRVGSHPMPGLRQQTKDDLWGVATQARALSPMPVLPAPVSLDRAARR